jgi:hypothetical protein
MIDTQIEIVGWRYEVYSETLETWRAVTTFTQTAPEIRERIPRMRALTPLVAVDAVITATRQTDDETETDHQRHTATESERHERTVAAARDGHVGDHVEEHE